MELNELTKAKVKYFFDNKIIVHISKNNGFFHNGIILESVEDYLIIDDERNGATPIYFLEIKDIEKRLEKE
jgi:hypothetical protein